MKKTDLDPLPLFTWMEVSPADSPTIALPPGARREDVAAIRAFMNKQRFGWTRAFGVGFGPPSPVRYAHLYDGKRYVGYFAVGAAVLPNSSALFETRYGNIYARKRVTRAEANQFLDLIGARGELSDNVDNEVRQQIANQPATSRAVSFNQRLVKFHPGDRVRVKTTHAEGTVCLRTSFFQENLYFVTLPGSYYVFRTIGEREEWARLHALSVAEIGHDFPEYEPRPWHEEGPFYESDLEPVR